MNQPRFPAGWDQARVQRLIDHYENMCDEEMIAEDEAAYVAGKNQEPVIPGAQKIANTGIVKGTRHQKIIGNFGETLLCNWLSRSGFEVAIVDHTGIDIIAYDPRSHKRLGITVKSRTRRVNTEQVSVNVFARQKGKDDRQKAMAAAEAFGCELWIGIYVETTNHADIYLTSEKNYSAKYRRAGKNVDDWKMTSTQRKMYASDPAVKHLFITFEEDNWDWSSLTAS